MCKTERSRHDAAPSLNSTWLILSRTDQIPSPDDLGPRPSALGGVHCSGFRAVSHIGMSRMSTGILWIGFEMLEIGLGNFMFVN